MSRSNRPAFSVIEMIVVLAIVVISILFINPGGGRARESRLGDAALMQLTNIFSAEKNYYLEKREYLLGGSAGELNSGLGLNIDNPNFRFVVRMREAGNGIRLIAQRTGGEYCSGRRIIIDSYSGEVTKECEVW